MSDYRQDEYYNDECSKYPRCERNSRRRSRSSTPEKCSNHNDCDCYVETRCCRSSRKCKCYSDKCKSECQPKCCEKNRKCKCSDKNEKYGVCNKLKLFEEGVFNAKNEKIFFITIG